jgi:hypothetical protein
MQAEVLGLGFKKVSNSKEENSSPVCLFSSSLLLPGTEM